MSYKFSYMIGRVFISIVMLFPRSIRKGLFVWLAKIAYLVDRKHRAVIDTNLTIAFGKNFPTHKRKEIAKECYKNMLLTLLQLIENFSLSSADLMKKVTFVNRKIVDDALAQNRKIIFISAHYGNWELGGALISSLINATTTVGKKLNNPYFDNYLTKARETFGIEMVEKKGALKFLAKALQNERAISLLIDQNTNERDGVVVDFFNKPARQTPATAFLARKFDALIVPVFIETEDYENYILAFHESIEVKKSEDKQKDILEASQKQSDAIESQIKKEPKAWFWCHRRWRNMDEEVYR